jgi:hypothetical protein
MSRQTIDLEGAAVAAHRAGSTWGDRWLTLAKAAGE